MIKRIYNNFMIKTQSIFWMSDNFDSWIGELGFKSETI